MCAPGDRVGDLELLACLGAGGQGEVFLGRPWQPAPSQRQCAAIWLRALLAADTLGPAEAAHWSLAAVKVARPAAADSLHDEHGHLAGPGADHPHLTQLYTRRYPGLARDSGFLAVDGGTPRPYLALAYEPGLTLDRRLRRGGLSLARAVDIVAQVAAALAHLHTRGIVHHDVRPANVIVRSLKNGRLHATLIDLGAADTPAAPRRRAVYGTTGYLPPERAGAEPAPPTPHVDVYSLGVLLRALTAPSRRSPALAALLSDATAHDLERRRKAIPNMEVMRARLEALPEAQPLSCAAPHRAPISKRT